jgi:hypothetical protein
MQTTFELSVVDYDLLELRWSAPFGRPGSAVYQDIADGLSAIPGVNRVEVLRYSAHIEIAPHVERLSDVLAEIEQWVAEDEQLRESLSVNSGVTDYGVTLVPGVVSRKDMP